jgi:hypothetical protein
MQQGAVFATIGIKAGATGPAQLTERPFEREVHSAMIAPAFRFSRECIFRRYQPEPRRNQRRLCDPTQQCGVACRLFLNRNSAKL